MLNASIRLSDESARFDDDLYVQTLDGGRDASPPGGVDRMQREPGGTEAAILRNREPVRPAKQTSRSGDRVSQRDSDRSAIR